MLNSLRVKTSTAALDAIKGELDRLYDPPSIDAQALREAIAIRLQLSVDCVAVGNGSTELMNILAKVKKSSEGEIIVSSPSFVLYEHLAKLYNYRLKATPLKNYHHNLEEMRRQVGNNTRIIFLDSPANVTGCTITDNDFLSFLDDLPNDTVVVYDNVYAEYQDNGSDSLIRDLILKHSAPVLICRSFSKAHCLFGLRIGYMLGRTDLVEMVRHCVMPFGVGSLAQCAAIASLQDDANVSRNVELNRKAREMACESLEKLHIAYVPTQSNALLINFGDKIESVESYLASRGIRVRGQSKCRITEHLQVFLIDPPSIQPFIEAVEKYFRR
ncbi:MAG TPA: histidinol-phosphate transaminase [bacterium]|mgnify:CR=1 FL=1|nr:histidinol-phosphate transaminase [bacterium]HNZ73259.1 histidinol-phosphate transaminase [bacterium]